jgi:2-dehydropantoate 2-reductase
VKIAVFGAGAIGCWVGGRLSAGGADVTLIGRPRVVDELVGGVRVSDLTGRSDGAHPAVATEVTAARGADVVLVTVKSAATTTAGEALAAVVPPGAIVVSLQNGVRNADALRAVLPDRRVLAGMVPFNVVRQAVAHYHRASAGTTMVERGAPGLAAACRAGGIAIAERDDMPAVQWAKLVMNLNNAINALSGIPLAEELGQHAFRRCLAACQREALDALDAAHVGVARLTAIPPRWMPYMLRAPDALFRRLAGKVLAIDPRARSSMWDDLEAGRTTEVDYIQGEVVALGERVRRATPVNRALVRLVRAAEGGGKRTFTGDELWRSITPPTA